MAFELDADYIDVAERIRQFREKYPEGTLGVAERDNPFRVVTIRDQVFVAVVAMAHRTPDDPCPGIGMAWEPVPGTTPYTRNSELMNAETSAWGRAIIAVGAADAKRIASAEEVRNRSEERHPTAAERVADGFPGAEAVAAAPPPPERATDRQTKAIYATLMGQGIEDKTAQLAIVSGIIGLACTDTRNLTKGQAGRVLDHLNGKRDATAVTPATGPAYGEEPF